MAEAAPRDIVVPLNVFIDVTVDESKRPLSRPSLFSLGKIMTFCPSVNVLPSYFHLVALRIQLPCVVSCRWKLDVYAS
jgi:hypothetical protein